MILFMQRVIVMNIFVYWLTSDVDLNQLLSDIII